MAPAKTGPLCPLWVLGQISLSSSPPTSAGYGGSPIESPLNRDVNSEELVDHSLAVCRASSCPSSHHTFTASVGFLDGRSAAQSG